MNTEEIRIRIAALKAARVALFDAEQEIAFAGGEVADFAGWGPVVRIDRELLQLEKQAA